MISRESYKTSTYISLSSSFSLPYLSRRRDRDEALCVPSPVPFGDSDSASIHLFLSSSRATSSSDFFLSLKITESQAGRSTVVGSIVGDFVFFSGNLDPVGDLIAVKIVPLCAVLHRLSSVDGGVPSSLLLYRRWKVACPLLDVCFKTPGVVTRGGTSKRLLQRDLFWALGPCGLLSFGRWMGLLSFSAGFGPVGP
ncbi:hypothetical protein F2Q69_00051240 [Brassica cretica]|uniref:Uncharacterized protein n=1 Tax=Brassica cretica TaxID=69181 RepID=A0A8S9PUC5_BRACR|nr:hypothetical protein F2Q69_00051240 [Brassica cretica]